MTWTEGGVPGSGLVIPDEEDRHVLVAVDAEPGPPVIYRPVTWLTAEKSQGA